MKDLNKYLIGAIIILLLLLTGAGFYIKKLKTDNREINDLYAVQAAELQTWKNKDGLNMAKIESFKTRETETFLEMKTKDSEIIRLQELVKEKNKYIKQQGDAITLLKSQTQIDTIITEPVPEALVMTKDSLSYSFDNKWIIASYGFRLNYQNPFERMEVQSTFLNLTVNNEYGILLGSESTGFLGLGKRKPFAEVTNYNPYTKTTVLRTYQVDGYPNSRFGVGLMAGYGFTSDLNTGIFVGVGVSYNLIKF